MEEAESFNYTGNVVTKSSEENFDSSLEKYGRKNEKKNEENLQFVYKSVEIETPQSH